MRDIRQLTEARERLGPLGALDFLISYHKQGRLCDHYERQHVAAIDVHEPDQGSPKVSVVMTAYNSAEYIGKAIESILCQTLKDIELIIVDDCSSDTTCEVILAFSERDARIRLLRCFQNRGTYWAKNLGIMHARGPVIALHDSDDVSKHHRLEKQLRNFSESQKEISYCSYQRVDGSGNILLNRGRKARLCFATAMFKKKLISRIGFFDSVRVAADAEFHSRIKSKYGSRAFDHLEDALYIAPIRSNSLSSSNPVRLDSDESHDQWEFLSESRKRYVDAFTRWHASERDLFMPFPLRKRPFPVPEDLELDAFRDGEMISASVASIPDRRQGLKQVVERVLPNVDQLYVYLNNYPDRPGFLKHKKIRVNTSDDFGDLKDNGKAFIERGSGSGIHFMLDDDLLYPSSYFDYLIAKILQYGRRCVVGVHGTQINKNFKRYHDGNSRTTFSFSKALDNERHVHIVGTGTCAFDRNLIGFSVDNAPSTGMLDLWFATYALRRDIPMVCVSRKAGWLKEIESLQKNSLYSQYINNDQMQTDLIKRERFMQKSLDDLSRSSIQAP